MMAASNADGYNSADAVQLGSGDEVIWGAVGGSGRIEGATSTSMNGAAEFKFVDDMGSEAVRLASYKSWPHSAPVNPSALARAGLFYTGKDDVVQCFSCDGQIKDWEYGDTAMGEHKSLFPNCEFVKGTDSRNDPLIKDMSRFAQLNVSSSQKENEDDDKGKGGTKENSGGEKGKKKKGKKKKGKKKQNDNDDDDSSIFNVEDDPQFIEANRVLKSEYKRLLTFINWPKNVPVLPEDLAKAGFYYCGSDDRVQCFCCYGILKSWRPGDSAMNEHRKYFPLCPFVRGEDVGNEPMRLVTRQGNVDEAPVTQTSRDPNRVENFQNQQQNQPPRNIYGASNTAAQTQSQHRHPEYADEDKRMATFHNWPSSDIVSPQELCRAGFYYTGIKDNVKCFHCDHGLRNWGAGEDPWTEHARWFSKCEYVLTEKGSAFVDYVTSTYPLVPRSNPQTNTMLLAQSEHRHPEYADEDKRMATFDHWPSSDIVSPQELSRAGFFYTGSKDVVRCFHCNGGLTEWEPGDEPWIEHARWLSNCKYILIMQGPVFVKKAVSRYPCVPSSNPQASGREQDLNLQEISKKLQVARDEWTCKVCWDRKFCILTVPCMHLLMCEWCSKCVRHCPMCRSRIDYTIKAIFA